MLTYKRLGTTASDIDRYVCLFGEVFAAGSMTPDVFQWKYVNNPRGASIVIVAEDDGRFVGARSFWADALFVGGELVKCYQPCDTMVSPDYRRHGIFTKLTSMALQIAGQEGCPFVFNLPNENSFPAYMRLGWQDAGSIETLVMPVDMGACLSTYVFRSRIGTGRSKPALPIRSGERSGPSRNGVTARAVTPALCAKFAEDLGGTGEDFVMSARTSEIFLWRFAQHPLKRYSYLMIERGVLPIGYAVVETLAWKGLVVGRLAEFVAGPEDYSAALAAIRRFMSGVGVHLVLGGVLRGQGKIGIQDRVLTPVLFRPSGVRLVYKVLNERFTLGTRSWFVSPATGDTA